MKIKKIPIEEMIQLIYRQIELKLNERYKYEKEIKKLYKLCKKSLLKKIKERFQVFIFLMKHKKEDELKLEK